MGNYLSCTLPLAAPLMKNARAARVVLPCGEVHQFRQPTKAVELMLHCPNFFLADARSLRIGSRFPAVGADHDLEFGSLYIMFPMRRLTSFVTSADVALLFIAPNSAAKREEYSKDNGDGRPRLSLEGGRGTVDEGSVAGPELSYSLSVCRSRKPLLETIKEEPVTCSS